MFGAMMETEVGSDVAGDDAMAMARACEYLLLGRLLSQSPPQDLLDALAALKGDATPLGMAHVALANAARTTTSSQAGKEFFNLFIGIGRGDLLPYASFYRTGFLHEKPLADVRADLARLGIERQPSVFEPEDHMGTMLEVMAFLVGDPAAASTDEADAFLRRHIAPWSLHFWSDLARAPAAGFYKAVAEVGRVWTEIELTALEFTDDTRR